MAKLKRKPQIQKKPTTPKLTKGAPDRLSHQAKTIISSTRILVEMGADWEEAVKEACELYSEGFEPGEEMIRFIIEAAQAQGDIPTHDEDESPF